MTDQPKYTKGPWLREGTTIYGLKSCGFRNGKELFQKIFHLRVFDGDVFTPREELEANARLIAAAPDLFEALKDAVRWLERLEDAVPDHFQHSAPFGCMELEGMKLAIAKAEGKETP